MSEMRGWPLAAMVLLGGMSACHKPSYLAHLLIPEDLLVQRVRNLCHTPCHNQCASKSSLGRIMAHEKSTLGVEAGFYARTHCFIAQESPTLPSMTASF